MTQSELADVLESAGLLVTAHPDDDGQLLVWWPDDVGEPLAALKGGRIVRT